MKKMSKAHRNFRLTQKLGAVNALMKLHTIMDNNVWLARMINTGTKILHLAKHPLKYMFMIREKKNVSVLKNFLMNIKVNASSAESYRSGTKRPVLAKSALKILPSSRMENARLAQKAATIMISIGSEKSVLKA